MDIFVLKALVDELQHHLPGALVSKVFQPGPETLILRLWRRQELRLLLSTHATRQRLHLTTGRLPNPPSPPRFAAFLRAHLQHVFLQAISLRPYDRVVEITWAHPGGSAPVLTLIHELLGPQSNIILTAADGIILEALTHVPPRTPQHRALLPGSPYQPLPPPPARLLLPHLTPAHLHQLHQQGGLDAPHLQRLLVGLSPLLASELLHRSQGQPERCWQLLQDLRHHYQAGSLCLWLCTTADGQQHLSALPLTHGATTVAPVARAQEAVDTLYQGWTASAALERLRTTTQKTLRQRLAKLRTKLANLEHDRQKLQDYALYHHYGTLLLSQRLPRGTTQATVIDYYSPEQSALIIPLDPRLSVHDNAQVYFKKYRKAKSGLAKVEALLTQYRQEERQLVDLLQQSSQSRDGETLQALAAALVRQPAAAAPRQAAGRLQGPASSPYRTFTSSDGYTLYCGKNDQGNEVLLRQLAAAEDLWFHAHRRAGAHVLLKVQPPREVPPRTLVEAAALAAFYSKGRHAASVEVIYTPARYVRKFRGARPGQVLVDTYRTLDVTPRQPDA